MNNHDGKKMKYTRSFVDSDGETHFEDLDMEFTEGKIWSGSPRLRKSETQPTSDSFFMEIYEDDSGEFHLTPRKQRVVVVSGTGEFGASDGEVRKLEPGEVVLLDDMGSKGHLSNTEKRFASMFLGLEEQTPGTCGYSRLRFMSYNLTEGHGCECTGVIPPSEGVFPQFV